MLGRSAAGIAVLAAAAVVAGALVAGCAAPEPEGSPAPSVRKLTAPRAPVFIPRPPGGADGAGGDATTELPEIKPLYTLPRTPPVGPALSGRDGAPAAAPGGSGAASGAGTAPPPATSADTGLTSADLERHVRTLASDAMAGRDTASPEGLAAAGYIEGVLQRAGLRAAGDDDSFLQVTDIRGSQCDGAPELAWIDAGGASTAAEYGADFRWQSGGALDAVLDLVVVRAAADVPAPPSAGTALLLLGGRQERSRWLEQAGAPDGRGFGLLLTQARNGGSERGAPITDPPHILWRAGGQVPPVLSVQGPLAERLASGDARRVRTAIRLRDGWPAVNVVGVLDGVGEPGHPDLAQQAIVFSAHYDHLGLARSAEAISAVAPEAGAPRSGAPGAAAEAAPPDLVYNGADDDASGVAAVLELAEAFGERARRGERPARTLVFLLVTGEERGLLGTSFYLEHPVAPLAQTVGNLNFEMIGRPDPLAGGAGRLWLTGFERSNLGPAWAAAGLPVSPDLRPDQHFFERSDNMAFVMRGVVGQTLSSYNLHDDYHTVRDEPDRLDYGHMETAVRAAFDAARTLADGSLLPQWTTPPPGTESPPAGR